MRWRGGRRSTNIEDRRGQRAAPKLLGGGLGTIAIVLIAMYFGVDPTPLLDGMQAGGQASTSGSRPSAEDLKNDPLADMVSVVVAGHHSRSHVRPRCSLAPSPGRRDAWPNDSGHGQAGAVLFVPRALDRSPRVAHVGG